MKTFCFILLSFFLANCANQKTDNNGYQLSKKESLANKITKQVAVQSKKEDGLYPCGSGGRTMDGIQMLALSFFYHSPLSVDEGRELVIKTVDRFVEALNEDEEIRPYLKNYPFEPKNVEICIFVQKPNGDIIDPEKPTLIAARRGLVNYEIFSDKTNRFTNIHTETYEEAVLKIQGLFIKNT